MVGKAGVKKSATGKAFLAKGGMVPLTHGEADIWAKMR